MDQPIQAVDGEGIDPAGTSGERQNGGAVSAGDRKTKEGPQHPNQDAQFRHINRQEAMFRASDDPMISVDTKKKELVGAFQNKGRTWRPQGQPYEVNVVVKNRAVVKVGTSHDTAEFAVESIRR